jgi:hypothetical protein
MAKEPKFVAYPKIPNINEKWRLANGDKEVVAIEKIHGSNFQLTVTAQDSILVGRRKAYLKAGESFFSHLTVVDRYQSRIIGLAAKARDYIPALLARENANFIDGASQEQQAAPYEGSDDEFEVEDFTDMTTVRIFCELFGGSFHGTSEAKQVQRGMNYHPSNDIMVFDIAVGSRWLDWDTIKQICLDSDVFHCPEVGRGVFREIESKIAPTELHMTLVPMVYGLTEPTPTLAEGIVIRQVVPSRLFKRGFPCKWKHPQFAEVARGPAKATTTQSAGPIENILQELSAYITAARVNAYTSKEGDKDYTNHKVYSQLLRGVVDDAVEDYLTDKKLALEGDDDATNADIKEDGESGSRDPATCSPVSIDVAEEVLLTKRSRAQVCKKLVSFVHRVASEVL